MSRIKATLIMAGLVVILAAVAVTSQAQPPPGGRGGRGGFGGPGGGMRGGGPGGMFGGGMFGGLLMLAQNGAVQEELKVTDRQKAAIQKIADDQGPRRQRVMDQLKNQTQRLQQQAEQQAQLQAQAEIAAQANANNDPRAFGNGAQELLNAANNRGFQGRDLSQPGIDPALAQQAARQRQREAGNMAQAQGRQMMGAAMQMLQQESERELAKVLDRNQMKRLREIQLQTQGASAVLRPEVAEKLQINDEQRIEIQEALAQVGQQRREMMTKNFQMFRNMLPNQPGGGPGGSGGGPPDPTAGGAPGGQGDQAAGGGPGGQGRRGQRGGPGGFRFDPEAMRKIMERPEVKAQIEESRKAQEQLRDREYAMVFRAMDRRQVASFKKMLGKPFDINLLTRGMFRGGPPGANPNANANASTGAAPSPPASEKAASEPAAPAASKPAPAARRPSLRERRGLGQQPTPN